MRTSKQILPGIKFIGWVDCRNLPDRVALSAICNMQIAVLTTIHPIPFFDSPECECVTKKDGAGYEDTATLKFSTGKQLPNFNFFAFVVTDVNDRSFLIGSKEPPFAIVEVNHKAGTPSGEAAGYDYEITHVAIKSMVPCII